VVLDSVSSLPTFSPAAAAAHRAAEVAKQTTMRRVDRNSAGDHVSGGYPLDQNFYQAIKGVAAAAEIVTDGGTIILAAECRYGLPSGGMYEMVLKPGEDIRQANARILASDGVVPDQWQLQVQARIQARARVLVRTSGIGPKELALARLEPVTDISVYVEAARQEDPEIPIAVLPHGPYCVPFVE
jgi:nickel-dependent lactate racemase